MDDILKKILNNVVEVVEMFDYSDTSLYKIRDEVWQALKKFLIKRWRNKFKIFFESSEFSNSDKNEEVKEQIVKKYFQAKIKLESVKYDIKSTLLKTKAIYGVDKFSPPTIFNGNITTKLNTKYTFSKELKDFFQKFEWASESITDLRDLIQLCEYVISNNSIDTLQSKMLFKESFSLIDRLRVEASCYIMDVTKVFGSEIRDDPKATREFRENYTKIIHQKILLNDNFSFLSQGKTPVLKKLEISDENWATIVFDDFDHVLSKEKNLLYKEVKDIRNGFEHHRPTDAIQYFELIGVLPEMNQRKLRSEDRKKIVDFWLDNFLIVVVLFIYHLIKLDEIILGIPE